MPISFKTNHPCPFRMVAKTHPGMVRTNNEDAVYCDAKIGIAIVADGIGGHNAGEVASQMAVDEIASSLTATLSTSHSWSENQLFSVIVNTVEQANAKIAHMAKTTAAYRGMGTTLVMGAWQADGVWIAHVGDSRAYVLQDHALRALTRDHSIIQEYIDVGLISEQDARKLSIKNLVTRALGVDNAVQVAIARHAIEEKDLFLLCSDGLSDMVSSEKIISILTGASSLEQKADALIKSACLAGGCDNVSVVLIQKV